MLGIGKKRPQDGNAVIEKTIGQFEDIIANLDNGASLNDTKIAANEQVIKALQVENTQRAVTSERGRNIAAKLRDFINAPAAVATVVEVEAELKKDENA